jgi:hypothetical protein
MLPVIFSHANSFPAGTYSLLFQLLERRGMAVQALDRLGHDPRFPVSDNWPHLVEQLADSCAARRPKAASLPIWWGIRWAVSSA